MSATNAFEAALIALIFNNTNAANIGDATGLRGSSTAGVFYISLHTADPGEAGNQSTSETSYGSYARQSVARSGAGLTCSGDTASNAATISFPQNTSGTPTITHVGLGTDVSGSGNLLITAALTTPLAMLVGYTPQFSAGELDFTCD